MNKQYFLIIGFFLIITIPIFVQSVEFLHQDSCDMATNSFDLLKCVNAKVLFFAIDNTIQGPITVENQQLTIKEQMVLRIENQIHLLINKERQANALTILEIHPYLTNAARIHSVDMGLNNYFAHDSLDGKKFSDRIYLAGLKCSQSAENIFKIPTIREENIAPEVVSGWMNSPGHRANILSNFTYEGIGVEISTDGYVYVTQDFC